jgi:hypothetical protein
MSQILPTEPADAGATIVEEVTFDLPCRKCGYNLRGLATPGRCPECGSAVGLSAEGDLLRFSDPAWIRSLRGGVRLIILGIVTIFLGTIAGILVLTLLEFRSIGEWVLQGAYLIGYALVLGGTWRLTEPDPSGIGEDRYGTARKVIRVTLALGVVSAFFDLFVSTAALPPGAQRLAEGGGALLSIAGVTGLVAQLLYLKNLALRIPAPELAKRAHFLTYAMGISYGLLMLTQVVAAIAVASGAARPMGSACGAGVLGLAVLVFFLMYVRMLERLGKRFGTEAHAAEQSWARVATPPAP